VPTVQAVAPHFSMPETATDAYSSDDSRWSALMASAQAGDERDYRELLSELSDVINRYLRSRIGQHDFVEDCVQESLIAIHRARHTYDPARRFRPWLFAIVRNKAIDMLRRHRSSQTVIPNDIDTQAQVTGEIDDDVAAGELMGCLSPEYRQAITLTKIVGLSNAEAAGQLRISESAMKVRVHRAIHSLKRLLEADVA
jgi:RNA polymerase sigma-70 factor (ECF subfamily)